MMLLGRVATFTAAAAKPAPLTDPGLRAEQSEAEGSLAGLAQAALLWSAVGHLDRSRQAIDSFLQRLRVLPNPSLEQVLDEAIWTDTQAWRNYMQALLSAYQPVLTMEKTATVSEKAGRYGLFSPHQRITLRSGTEPEIQPRDSPLPWSRIGL
jgi:hypothetical protein